MEIYYTSKNALELKQILIQYRFVCFQFNFDFSPGCFQDQSLYPTIVLARSPSWSFGIIWFRCILCLMFSREKQERCWIWIRVVGIQNNFCARHDVLVSAILVNSIWIIYINETRFLFKKIICSHDSKFHLPVHKPWSVLPVDLVNHPPPGGSMLLRQLANVSRVRILIYISSWMGWMSIVGIVTNSCRDILDCRCKISYRSWREIRIKLISRNNNSIMTYNQIDKFLL